MAPREHQPNGTAGGAGRSAEIIRFVRRYHLDHGHYPSVAHTCRWFGLLHADLLSLFPDGYRVGVLEPARVRTEDGGDGDPAGPTLPPAY